MKKEKIPLKAPKSILVIITRRIGDVLMATPVFGSLRHSYQNAKLDVVVYKGTEGCIAANKDIDHIIPIMEKATLREQIKTVCKLFRRYDLAISILPGDRPTFYSWLAGKRSIGLVENGYKHLWKRALLDKYELFDNYETHTINMNLSLLKLIDVRQIPEVIISWAASDEIKVKQILPFNMEKKAYAVVHIYPMFTYKMWNHEGWADLICWLKSKGLRTVLTGSNSLDELKYISLLCQSLSCDSINLAGALNLGGLAYLLSKASVYIGLDTSVTHMAAALGIPTIALYGPTNPVKWGPMPENISFPGKSPYKRKGSQMKGNVFILQGKGNCVPCHKKGCDRHRKSFSRCLQDIPSADVIEAVKTIMAKAGNRQPINAW
ncbi:MAG: glycosyltransferase family 9 protein [Thermotogota bacterium]|nr:glycosyltransferase family 9 protein [Thermotogota bacterium]